ncbi:MAG: hypothetical protein JRN09_08535 [Nitrososphaerota archaeon]|nr:hypothetical protein [Nitrososphaerota archaeon]
MTPEKDVMLVFQNTGVQGGGGPVRGGIGGISDEVAVKVQEIAGWFSDFDIDQIQVSISGCVSTGSALKLIINAQGTGGVTLTLKPRAKAAGPPPAKPTG